jgi:murein peptide amidase A
VKNCRLFAGRRTPRTRRPADGVPSATESRQRIDVVGAVAGAGSPEPRSTNPNAAGAATRATAKAAASVGTDVGSTLGRATRSRTPAVKLCVVGGMALASLFAAVLLSFPPTSGAALGETHELLGYSARGEPIRVHEVGNLESPKRVLVVGCIHGDEHAGFKITRRLLRAAPPRGIDLWVIHNLNPDGYRLGVRQNGRGVDLNRNFRSEWIPIGQPWDPEYSGPYPFSEPESRIARDLIRRIRPDVTIWYHQPQALVRAWGQSRSMARRYARLARMPYRSIPWPHGTAPNWQNHRFPGTAAFVVELAAGPLSARQAERHAHAVRRLLLVSS